MKIRLLYFIALSLFIPGEDLAWPWDGKKMTNENVTPTVSSADIKGDEAQEKKWENIVPDFKVTRKAEKKLYSINKEYSEKFNLEKSKFGEASKETAFYHGWANALYSNNVYVNQKDFKQKYFKVRKLWEKYERVCEIKNRSPLALDTPYSANLYKLKYAYENFVISVASIDNSIMDFGFGETCEDSKILEQEARDVEVFKEVDSELGDWLSKLK
jgi:hypothetical protein